jgi:YD repeat-containing protein
MLRLLVLILLVSSCNNVKKNKNYEFKGNVKSYKEISYEAIKVHGGFNKGNKRRDNELNGLGHYDLFVVLDKNHNVIESSQFDSDGNLIFKSTYSYNKNGNVIEAIDNDGGYSNYIYDEKGYLIGIDFHIVKETYSIQKYVFLNDNKGNLLERKGYDFYNRLSSTSTFKYDEHGNIIESKEYDIKGDLKTQYIYMYNESGKKTEEYVTGKVLISGKYKGLYYGTYTSKITYKYDENGNVILQMIYGENDEIEYIRELEYIYQYDKIGNWITKMMLENEDPKFILEREIEYFN